MAGVIRIDAISIRNIIFLQRKEMGSPDITVISCLKGIPSTAFSIRNGYGTCTIFIASTLTGKARMIRTTGWVLKSGGFRLIVQGTNMVVWDAAIITTVARKCRNTATGINDYGLSLRWCSAPNVNVMRSISLIQGSDLFNGCKGTRSCLDGHTLATVN